MGRFSFQNSFRLGQVSRKFATRDDLGVPSNGVELFRNVIPKPSGGFERRPGTLQTDNLGDWAPGTLGVQLIPFVYSETEAYCVQWHPGDVTAHRVRKDLTSALITPTVSDTHNALGSARRTQFAQSGDTLILVHPSMRPKKLVRTAANTFTLSHYIPNANTREAVLAMAYRKKNISTMTMTPAATTGTGVNLTASSAFWNSGHVGTMFKVTHGSTTGVCRIVGFTSTTVVTVDIIIDFGATTASTNWQEGAWSDYRGWPGAISFADGRLCLGGNTAEPDRVWASVNNNYGIFMQNKLAQDASSDTSGLNYFGDIAESDATDFAPAATEINNVSWLAFGRSLMMGTEGGVFAVQPGVTGNPISTGSTRMVPVSQYGAAAVQPVVVGQDVVFVTKDRMSLVKLSYDETYGKYKDVNLNGLNDQIANKAYVDFIDSSGAASACPGAVGFGELCYDSGRRTIWAVASWGTINYGGQLVGVTLSETGDLAAWHEHVLGGPSVVSGGLHGPDVKSVCMTPSAMIGPELVGGTNMKTQALLWIHADRKLPTGSYALVTDGYAAVEVMLPRWDRNLVGTKTTNPRHQNLYLDAARVFTNSPATATHSIGSGYNGDVMQVIAADLVKADVTIASGNAVLAASQTYVQIGFNFTPQVKGFPIPAGGTIGSSHGEIRRVDELRLEFYRTLGVYFGDNEDDDLEEIQFRTPDDPMDEQTPLFTGTKVLDFDGDYDTDPYVYLEQQAPLPMTVSAWVVKGMTNEE